MSMTLQQQITAQAYIQRNLGAEFQWGVQDCNQFFIGFHDAVYGTQDLPRVKRQYHSASTARRFLRSLGLTAAQWLHLRGYQQIGTTDFHNGDVVLLANPGYSTAFVWFEGLFYSCLEQQGCGAFTTQAVIANPHTVWRK